MRYLAILIIWLWPVLSHAQEWEDRRVFGNTSAAQTLRIISSTDTSFFAPILHSFLESVPDLSVEYLVTSTTDLDRRFRSDPQGFDVAVSSAMDLQLKLANDGYALSLSGITHPVWAQWRSSLFAFTTEPAAIVINKSDFADAPLPQTRQELIQILRADPARFRGRVGTYDVRQSGVGYLFATQDARASETYWRLMEIMGSLDARLYCCSGEMIDDLASGKIAMAYNVLGSYAAARDETAEKLAIILPSDFPTTMMRTALVSRETELPAVAEAFVRHLTGRATNNQGDQGDPLPGLGSQGDLTGQATIALEPALMTYLDRMKRRTFLREWESAIIQSK